MTRDIAEIREYTGNYADDVRRLAFRIRVRAADSAVA
jgi:hypothetical protein